MATHCWCGRLDGYSLLVWSARWLLIAGVVGQMATHWWCGRLDGYSLVVWSARWLLIAGVVG